MVVWETKREGNKRRENSVGKLNWNCLTLAFVVDEINCER
jgi:hypothetical protein